MRADQGRSNGPAEVTKGVKIVIVGNGIAGVSAAHAIRTVSRHASVTIVSDEPGPAYSACVLPHYVGGEIERDKVIIKNFSAYSVDGIELLARQKVAEVNVEDRRVILADKSLSYDKLILATGSEPVIPASIRADTNGVFTFKSLSDADRIAQWKGRKAVIVGSGPIGLEAGMALKRRGYEVVVIELLAHILPKVFDAYPAGLIKAILEQDGIDVLEGERLVEIQGSHSVSGVRTTRRTMACDTVILATGMKARVNTVFDKVKLGKYGGISVDQRMRTNVDDVFACGDCVEAIDVISGQASRSMLWHNARRQGDIAGCNAAGIPLEYSGSLNVTGVNLFGIQAVSLGMGADGDAGGSEVIEKVREGGYLRVILQRSEVVGVQTVNWSQDLGYLLTSIVRKEKVANPWDALANRKPPARAVRPFATAHR